MQNSGYPHFIKYVQFADTQGKTHTGVMVQTGPGANDYEIRQSIENVGHGTPYVSGSVDKLNAWLAPIADNNFDGKPDVLQPIKLTVDPPGGGKGAAPLAGGTLTPGPSPVPTPPATKPTTNILAGTDTITKLPVGGAWSDWETRPDGKVERVRLKDVNSGNYEVQIMDKSGNVTGTTYSGSTYKETATSSWTVGNELVASVFHTTPGKSDDNPPAVSPTVASTGQFSVVTTNSPLEADTNKDGKVSPEEALAARSAGMNAAYGLGGKATPSPGFTTGVGQSEGSYPVNKSHGFVDSDGSTVVVPSTTQTPVPMSMPVPADKLLNHTPEESSWSGDPGETAMAPTPPPQPSAIQQHADAGRDPEFPITLPPTQANENPAAAWQALNPPVDTGNQTGHGFTE